jgi:DNA polymerase-3 subunit gamma/tau
LIDHLRQILLVKLSGVNSSFMTLTDVEKEKYAQAASLYSREQCLDLIEYLIEAQNQLRTTPFGKTLLETILLHVMRSHFRLSIEQLVRHLSELEQMVNDRNESTAPTAPQPQIPSRASTPSPPNMSMPSNSPVQAPVPKPPVPMAPAPKPASVPAQTPMPVKTAPTPPVTKAPPPPPTLFESFTTEDPTPTPADLGKSPKITKPSVSPSAPPLAKISPPPSQDEAQRPMHAYDTLMHFAAVELDGRLQKN